MPQPVDFLLKLDDTTELISFCYKELQYHKLTNKDKLNPHGKEIVQLIQANTKTQPKDENHELN